jgi:hypothetical protein
MGFAKQTSHHLGEMPGSHGDRFIAEESFEILRKIFSRGVPEVWRFLEAADNDHLQIAVNLGFE